jgi:hypothetical protein
MTLAQVAVDYHHNHVLLGESRWMWPLAGRPASLRREGGDCGDSSGDLQEAVLLTPAAAVL